MRRRSGGLEEAPRERLTLKRTRLQVIVDKQYNARAVRQTVSHLSIEKRWAYNSTGPLKQSNKPDVAGLGSILNGVLNQSEAGVQAPARFEMADEGF